MLSALLLPVAAVCFVVGLVLILERPRKRTISLTERPHRVSRRRSRSTRPARSTPSPRSIPSARAMRSVGDEAEEWLHKQA